LPRIGIIDFTVEPGVLRAVLIHLFVFDSWHLAIYALLITLVVFVVDTVRDEIAVNEARNLNIPVIAIVDTNSNPNIVDYAIPANDDAAKSVQVIMESVVKAIQEGLSERKVDKDKDDESADKEQMEVAAVAETPAEDGDRKGKRTRKS
jgi:small subunit ribosomal protein S2